MSIACSPSWDSLFDLDMIGIAFWNWNSGRATLKLLIAAPLPPKPATTETFFSDASQLACAAHSGDGKLIANSMVTELERAESSTFRE